MFKFNALISKLNIAQRILGSVCFFSLPLAVLFYFNMDQIGEKMNFAQGERAGNRFQSPAVRLVKALTDYQLASGTQDASADALAARQEVDKIFLQLDSVAAELSQRLSFSDSALKEAGAENLKLTELHQKWTVLQAEVPGSPTKSNQEHFEQLIGALTGC